jgi:4-aminobutyrate aminotransferase
MNTKKLYDEYMITSMVAELEPVIVERAHGCEVTGHDGKTYLDCYSGIAVTNAGHGHPRVVAAAKAQIDHLVHCSTYVYYNPRAGEFAKRLSEITPTPLKKSFLANSGAEAIEGALRIAKQFTKRKEIVALTMGFHGRTVGTLSVSGNRRVKKGTGAYLSGVAFAPAPYCYRCPFKSTYPGCGVACAEYLEQVLRFQTSGDVAAFLAEPVMGEGGIIVPPKEYLPIVAGISRGDGALFIADEVQSGFGRTGRMFAVEHSGVEPDILCMAKGIADGFPLSAFIVREMIATAFTPGDHLSTFGGNPVSCAAALANIEVLLEEDLSGNAGRRGAQIVSRLQTFQPKCSLLGDVRGKGLMIGLELVNDAHKTPAVTEAKLVRDQCREKGLLVGLGGVYGNVIRLQPPLVLTEAQADAVGDIIEQVLQSVAGR